MRIHGTQSLWKEVAKSEGRVFNADVARMIDTILRVSFKISAPKDSMTSGLRFTFYLESFLRVAVKGGV